MRWSASPGGPSTSSPASPAASSSISSTGWGRSITCRKIIGRKDTPVRRVIHRALEKIDLPVHCLAMVVDPEARLRGLFAGDVREAWSAAADLSADDPHRRRRSGPSGSSWAGRRRCTTRSGPPARSSTSWSRSSPRAETLIVYAPHIREISSTWGDADRKDRLPRPRLFPRAAGACFAAVPRGVLAHSTHVCGTGCYENGVETPDVKVVLATAIPEETCRRIGLGYLDPASIRIDDYRGPGGGGHPLRGPRRGDPLPPGGRR